VDERAAIALLKNGDEIIVFEEWMRRYFHEVDLTRDHDGIYLDRFAHGAFMGWTARASFAQLEAAA